MAIILRDLTQYGSFRSQLHQFNEARHTVSEKSVADGVYFLAVYSLWWTMCAIVEVAELLAT